MSGECDKCGQHTLDCQCLGKIKWHLENRKIKDLHDYHKNPRRMTKEQASHLTRSLEKFGIIDKPVINTDNTIIGGHQRLKILKKMGHKEIECHVPDRPLSQKDVEELNIRHNKNLGEWDFDILANEWECDNLLEWGFSTDDLQLDGWKEDDDEESDTPIEPVKDAVAMTKLGDIYELGLHRLICEDEMCLDYCDVVVQRYAKYMRGKGQEPVIKRNGEVIDICDSI